MSTSFSITNWKDYSNRRVHRLRVWIDSELCVYAADLPGCVSQGDSIDECLANIREAFIALVESYDQSNESIPWKNGGQRPLFHEERSITVDLTPDFIPRPIITDVTDV